MSDFPPYTTSVTTSPVLSRRDMLAGMAMQGYLSNLRTDHEFIAKEACLFADALIEELDKEEKQ